MDVASKVGTAEGTLLGDTLTPDVKPSDSVGLNTVRSVLAKPRPDLGPKVQVLCAPWLLC